MIAQRDDDDWTSDLASEDAALREDAVSDLRDMLLRGLAKSLSKQGRVDDAFLEDTVQEASMKILEKLGDFEGRSKFRTWAVTIAVRTAVSKMRKRDWQNVSLDSVTSSAEFDPQVAVDRSETIDSDEQPVGDVGQAQRLDRQRIDGEAMDRGHGGTPRDASPCDRREARHQHEFDLQVASRRPEKTSERLGSRWIYHR